MSMHKGMLGQTEGGASVSGRKEETTLGDYIARKTRHDAFTQVAAEKKLSFKEWYIENEIKTYDKTEYDCMKMAWDASKEN